MGRFLGYSYGKPATPAYLQLLNQMIHYILGISCYYHDSAAALIKDGDIVAAAQEERFSQRNMIHDFLRMPLNTA